VSSRDSRSSETRRRDGPPNPAPRDPDLEAWPVGPATPSPATVTPSTPDQTGFQRRHRDRHYRGWRAATLTGGTSTSRRRVARKTLLAVGRSGQHPRHHLDYRDRGDAGGQNGLKGSLHSTTVSAGDNGPARVSPLPGVAHAGSSAPSSRWHGPLRKGRASRRPPAAGSSGTEVPQVLMEAKAGSLVPQHPPWRHPRDAYGVAGVGNLDALLSEGCRLLMGHDRVAERECLAH
jgi:hypothetical protein